MHDVVQGVQALGLARGGAPEEKGDEPPGLDLPPAVFECIAEHLEAMSDVWALTATCTAARAARCSPTCLSAWLLRNYPVSALHRTLAEWVSNAPAWPAVLYPTLTRLLEQGADPNAVPLELGLMQAKAPPLYLAALLDLPDALQALLRAGAAHGATTQSGERMTPLHAARSAAAVRVLLAAGSDPHALNLFGGTPLHAACARGDAGAVAELLRADGVDPNDLDGKDQTPLHIAAMWGHEEVVRVLLSGGADPCVKGTDSCTPPLSTAVLHGRMGVAALLEAAAAIRQQQKQQQR